MMRTQDRDGLIARAWKGSSVERNSWSDTDLVIAARTGDSVSLGVLLERYRAPLHAVALRMLGYGPQAQDAVHDTFMIALHRLDSIQDPGAIGGWLRAVLRNVCLESMRRTPTLLPLDDTDHSNLMRSPEMSLEERIDQLALKEWVWTALSTLPETLRVTAMLRYFGSRASYEEIALVLDVPVGTVKSRLNQVKVKLADALLSTVDLDHSAARRRSDEAREYFAAATEQMNRDGGYAMFADAFSPDPELFLPDGTTLRGRHHLVRDLESDMTAGIKMQLADVFASDSVMILEANFENPNDDPNQCPPATTQVHFQTNGRTERIRLYFASRSGEEDEDREPGRHWPKSDD